MPSFRLRPTQPFRLDLTSWVLRRRPDNTWDSWDGETYRRVLVVEGVPKDVSAVQRGNELLVTLSGTQISSRIREQVIVSLRKLLGIDADLSAFYRFAQSDRQLAPLAERFRGFKPPRFLTLFEGLVNGISCQQLSLTVGIILLNRLVEHYGRELHGRHAFPEPSDVKAAHPEQLVRLGYSYNKARSLIELAQAISDGRFQPASVERANDRDALANLQQLRGIGRWTAEYVLLRVVGRTTIFPGDDVGARNNLESWLGLRKPLTYDPRSTRFEQRDPIRRSHLLSPAARSTGALEIPEAASEIG